MWTQDGNECLEREGKRWRNKGNGGNINKS